MKTTECKICRRLGAKLFLKGERCFSPKCAMVKRPYPPGKEGKRRKAAPSEYAKQLKEKQKLRDYYNLRERQFKNYIKEILAKKTKTHDELADLLIRKLESRLDSVVFRMGFARSRKSARQLVSHGHFLVNGKKVNIPSYQVKKGDVISLRLSSHNKAIFRDLPTILKKMRFPLWLKVDINKLEGEIIGFPTFKEAGLPIEISAVFEYYSR